MLESATTPLNHLVSSEDEDEEVETTAVRIDANVEGVLQFGVFPTEVIYALKCTPPHQIDWKEKERAAEDLLFYTENVSIADMPKLACYAGSFLDFVVEHLLDDRTLKVVRIGVRLIKFTLHNFENMAEKANLVTLTATMLEMLNDPKGILR